MADSPLGPGPAHPSPDRGATTPLDTGTGTAAQRGTPLDGGGPGGRATPERGTEAAGATTAAPDGRWAAAADLVTWDRRPDELWRAGPRYGTWFPGGRLNAATICVDRHAAARPEATAVSWEGEPGEVRTLTFAELQVQTDAVARALRGLGVGRGDVVALHLSWLPETVAVLMGCARVGAVASLVPTPLPPEALADRLEALAPKVLFTQDGAWRRGTVVPLKARADDAIGAVGGIEHNVVIRRTGIDVAWFEGDRWYHDLVDPEGPEGPEGAEGPDGPDNPGRDQDATADSLPADHPLLLVSLAHRQGRPVVVAQGTAGLVVSAAAVHRWGLADGDVLWCAGEVSWLGTLAHGIYGPLANGTTAVMYEGTLDVPDRSRAWAIMRGHGVTTLLTTPSVLQAMRDWALELDQPADAGRVRRVVAFGEQLGPSLQRWLVDGFGGRQVSVADGWGQMELGGIVWVHQPVQPDAMPDVGALVTDRHGTPLAPGEAGELVLTRPWAGALVGASGPVEVMDEIHWGRIPGVYATGDRVRVGDDGSMEWLGRLDEVVSVSGQLVSLTEVRDVLLEHPHVHRADVVERRDPLGGRFLAAAVVLVPEAQATPDLAPLGGALNRIVRDALGGLAKPRFLMVVDRFGDELRGDERRRALSVVPVPDTTETKRLTWEQVLAAAAENGSH